MSSGSSMPRYNIAFEEIEHTADRALKIYGRNLEELLVSAAFGLNSLVGVDDTLNPPLITKSIELDALDAESLLVEWLSELAYWAEAEMLIFSKFDLYDVSTTRVNALIHGSRVTRMENHIKAVTYHNLEITESESGLAATVVFDV